MPLSLQVPVQPLPALTERAAADAAVVGGRSRMAILVRGPLQRLLHVRVCMHVCAAVYSPAQRF